MKIGTIEEKVNEKTENFDSFNTVKITPMKKNPMIRKHLPPNKTTSFKQLRLVQSCSHAYYLDPFKLLPDFFHTIALSIWPSY